jgi:hypothetical protein
MSIRLGFVTIHRSSLGALAIAKHGTASAQTQCIGRDTLRRMTESQILLCIQGTRLFLP